ncbi:MAG: bifunctional protein-serine/threonine kinase/phosphatase [Verrucomicrobium sp.]
MKILPSSYGMAREKDTPSSDAFAVKAWGETVIAVLADGAGTGQPAREAAQRAVTSLVNHYEARPRSWDPSRALGEFTKLLNRMLYQESMARYERAEMVSTLAVAVIEGDRLYGVNVGDSRICLGREGSLRVLSQDHIDEVRHNVLTRALGMAPDIEPHLFEAQVQDGDVALLCSDGVSNHYEHATLAVALDKRSSARTIVQGARSTAKTETLDDMSAIVIDIAQTGKLRAMSERILAIPAALTKGEVVDGYSLIRPLQTTGRVWLAEKEGTQVVLKFAPVEAIESEQHLNAYVREVWNATRLSSDSFVRAQEPAEATMRYYVMEFVNAPSLATLLTTRRLHVDEAVALGKFLTRSATALLKLDLVHADIKPENLLVQRDGDALSFKLVDLGSAAEVFSITSRAGTASYLAPERFHGAPASERTEIFAMGVTLYQALTGRLPHGQIERFQTPVFHRPKAPSRLNANLPGWLEAVLLRAISIEPERRYQHYSELAFDLANPGKVQPFHEHGASLLERNPLAFYRTGFFILLAAFLWLLLQWFSRA